MGADNWAAGEDRLTRTNGEENASRKSLLIGFQSYYGPC